MFGLFDFIDEGGGGVAEAGGHGFEEAPEDLDGDALFDAHQFDEVFACDGEELGFVFDDDGGGAGHFVDESHFSEVIAFAEHGHLFAFALYAGFAFEDDVEDIADFVFFDDTFAFVVGFEVSDVHDLDEFLVGHVLEEGDFLKEIHPQGDLGFFGFVAFGGVGSGPDEDGGDVVFSAAFVGEVDQAFGDFFDIFFGHVGADFAFLEVAVESVRTQQEAITIVKVDEQGVDFDGIGSADSAGDHVFVGGAFGFFFGDQAHA